MQRTYILQRRRTRRLHDPRSSVPPGRVRLVGEPRIGHRLVMFGDHAVIQTSPVRRFVSTEHRVAIETINSVYVLAFVPENDEPSDGPP